MAQRHKTPFGMWLYTFIKAHDLTQEEVGTLIGVDQPTISRLINGARALDMDTVVALHRGFGKIGLPVRLNDMLSRAGLPTVGEDAAPGGAAAQLSLLHADLSSHESSDTVQDLYDRIFTALNRRTLRGPQIERALALLIELRKDLESQEDPQPDSRNGNGHASPVAEGA